MAKQSTDEILGMMRSMNTGPRAERKSTPQASNTAPIELMSQFLLFITDEKMSEALDLSSEILRYEPNNKVVREYQVYLREYIAQGLDVEEEESDNDEEDEEEDDSDNDENDSKDSENDNEQEGKYSEGKYSEDDRDAKGVVMR